MATRNVTKTLKSLFIKSANIFRIKIKKTEIEKNEKNLINNVVIYQLR